MQESYADQPITLTTGPLNLEGCATFDHDSDTFDVPFVLPEESIQARKRSPLGRQKQWLEPVAIEMASEDRQAPPCPHFTKCGGCSLQHLGQEAYKRFIGSQIKGLAEDNHITAEAVDEPIMIPAGNRRRTDFEARRNREGLRMGFTGFRDKYIFNLEHCPILAPELEAMIPDLRLALEAIMQEREKAHIYMTLADNGIDLLIAGFKRLLSEEDRTTLKDLHSKHRVARLRYKVKGRYFHVGYTESPQIEFGGQKVDVNCTSFLQASKASDEILGQLVKEALGGQDYKVADLFSGRGTLSLPLLDSVFQCDAFESDVHALRALSHLSLANFAVFERNLFDYPLNADDLCHYDAAIINPPRAGAGAQCSALARSQVEKVVYVSCNPESFAKDARTLMDGGYRLEKLTPVDQFIWTPHLELVGVFVR